MENLIDIQYAQTGQSSNTNAMGMREMQAMVYAQRDRQHLLVKAPPASGKSRAMMFVALDKLANQGIAKVIVAVPQKNIGRSFRNIPLKKFGFFQDWTVAPKYNLCDSEVSEARKSQTVHDFLTDPDNHTLVCTHATLLNAMKDVPDEQLNNVFFGIDEFHHGSADEENRLGNLIRRLLNQTSAHILAMTGSYFRGDGVPVMRPEDEAAFQPTINYNYYQQLNGYRWLKSLGIGYQFFTGKFIDALPEALDTHRKTLIHIPSVQSKTTYANKYDEVQDIINLIGTVVEEDYDNHIKTVKTADGRLLKVADLVEDTQAHRDALQAYLQRMDSRDSLDILIALGTAKEGFDWEWCETCLTIGVRASLTEIVQIVGRCTRDCEGKTHAQFTNMIPCPDASQEDVIVAVNDMLKAVSASLLMEQVMSPKWDFKTRPDTGEAPAPQPEGDNPDIPEGAPSPYEIIGPDGTVILIDPLGPDQPVGPLTPDVKPRSSHSIVVTGLTPATERVQAIVDNDLDTLTATTLSDSRIRDAIISNELAEVINKVYIPKIIQEKYPELTDEEVDQLRERVVLSNTVQGVNVEVDSSGNRFVQIANKFVNLNKLSINLVDQVNPFHRAYEIMSKTLNPEVLHTVQYAIEEQRAHMDKEEAILTFQKYMPRWKEEHPDKKEPDFNDPDPHFRRLALAINWIRNAKRNQIRKQAEQ